MVRGIVHEHIFRRPWERVTTASWREYADMEHRRMLSHIVDVRIVNRSVDQEAGQLPTTRAITVKASGPWWLQRLMGRSVCQCLEESIVDNEWTLLLQETNMTCASMPALKAWAEEIEQKCIDKFQQNSARGREVLEYVCKALERAESTAAAALTTKSEPQLVNSQQSSSSSRNSYSTTNMMQRILKSKFWS